MGTSVWTRPTDTPSRSRICSIEAERRVYMSACNAMRCSPRLLGFLPFAFAFALLLLFPFLLFRIFACKKFELLDNVVLHKNGPSRGGWGRLIEARTLLCRQSPNNSYLDG